MREKKRNPKVKNRDSLNYSGFIIITVNINI